MAHCLGPLTLLFCFESTSGLEKCAPESKLSHQNRSTSGTIEVHHASSWIGYSSSPILFSHYLRSHPMQSDKRQRQRERGAWETTDQEERSTIPKWTVLIPQSELTAYRLSVPSREEPWTWKLTWKKNRHWLTCSSDRPQFSSRSSLNEEKAWASIDHGYRLIWTNWKVKHFLSHTDIYIYKHTHKSI